MNSGEETEGCGNFIGPYPCCSIITGDAKELAQSIPDESVDLIFTDPVYDRIEDYRWLAKRAARILKDDATCLVWLATPMLQKILNIMCPPLNYAWLLEWHRHSLRIQYGRTGISVITLCLWLEKGKSKTFRRIAEIMPTGNTEATDGGHSWSKPQNLIAKWLDAFVPEFALIFDPFCGAGTVPVVCKMLGRHYLAFEITPEVAERARQRVRKAQPPLFVMEPEQTEMDLVEG